LIISVIFKRVSSSKTCQYINLNELVKLAKEVQEYAQTKGRTYSVSKGKMLVNDKQEKMLNTVSKTG